MQSARELMDTLPQQGNVEWIGIRPARDAPLSEVKQVAAKVDYGLAGDHYTKVGGKRQVTLIQAEHLSAVASILGIDVVEPRLVRRNIVISGINLLALKNKNFFIGDVEMSFGALCVPCPLMEIKLGTGGFNAMRGHGGITAQVISSGTISVGDKVRIKIN